LFHAALRLFEIAPVLVRVIAAPHIILSLLCGEQKRQNLSTMKPDTLSLVVFALLTYFVPTPGLKAVVPPPDGGYPNFTTAEGTNALQNLTTGAANTAVGWFSLFGDTTASFNTGVGAGTLLFNNGDQNTAVGAVALLSNTTGSFNTATGVSALSSNTTGVSNNAFGWGALLSNTTGNNNTAIGVRALQSNTEGVSNVAVGETALSDNTIGSGNTATGYQALSNSTAAFSNTAIGYRALFNTTGDDNTAIGYRALLNNTIGEANTATGLEALMHNTGSNNTALGYGAGSNLTTGHNNVCIGAGANGFAGEGNTTRIINIWGQPGGTQAVYVDSGGRLGANTSSRRFKEEIKPMDKASEMIYSLKPVSFRYKTEIEPTRPLSFGLIAEDVEQINTDLVIRGKDGKVSTVRYEAVNAMLLNEFLKEHHKNEEQGATIAQQQKEIDALKAELKEQASQIQKVSAQLELSRPAPQTVKNAD
jgi:trimeric autotransporter adhesin